MVHTPRKLKYIVVALAIASFAVNLVVTANSGKAVNAPVEPLAPAAAPVARPQENRKQVVSLKRLDTAGTNSNALAILRLSNREPGGMFKLSTVNGTFVFRDDGQGGDEREGDGAFSTLLSVDFKALAADQQAFERDVISA